MKYQDMVAAARQKLSADEFLLWKCEVDAAVAEVLDTIDKLAWEQQGAVLLKCAEKVSGKGDTRNN